MNDIEYICCICGKKIYSDKKEILGTSWTMNKFVSNFTVDETDEKYTWCFECDKKPEAEKYKQISRENYKKYLEKKKEMKKNV